MSIKDFTILAKLGEGAYSTVYKVERLADSKPYALKKVKLGNLSDKQAENALNEVRILASIKNPNIVSYKEAFLEGKSLCIIMEFADDGDLHKKITENRKKKRYFDEKVIWKVVIHVIRGLKQLHDKKILHRDIKTANIFLNTDSRAQLGDMNVSKIAQNGLLYTQTGTPYYASPEVWNEQPYDIKSDIWSLGCVIYEMTSLEVPFKAEDMEGLANSVTKGKFQPIPSHFSKDLSMLINTMLQLRAKNRPNCDKILKSSLLVKKINQLSLEVNKQTLNSENELLQTIRMPRKLEYLTDRLPKSNYSYSQQKLDYSLSKEKRPERERTNTLPKLDKILRHHENVIQERKEKKKKTIPNENNLLYIEGISKSIGDIRINLPERSRVYELGNPIEKKKKQKRYNHNSRECLLPPIRR